MRDLIEQRTNVIIDQLVWAVGRAGAMLWIQIGECHTVAAWGGGTKEVGKYAIHVDCSWRWVDGTNVIADQDSSLDQLCRKLQSPILCRRVLATDEGSLEITFSDDSVLKVEVDTTNVEDGNEEMWRFFQPGVNSPHFVVGSQGILV